MSDSRAQDRRFSLRLPAKLAQELKRLADRESNPPSATARRLISAGLQREARTDRTVTRDDEESIAS